MDPPVRLAELMATLSMATDLAMGQPMEQALRSCLIAVRLGEALGLGRILAYAGALLGLVSAFVNLFRLVGRATR